MTKQLLIMLVFFSVANFSLAEFSDWVPEEDGYDWIKLSSGEWLKGEFIMLYRDTIEFDSEEMSLQSIDFEDIIFLRTSGEHSVRLMNDKVVDGKLLIDTSTVNINSIEETFGRDQLVSIADAGKSEWDLWSGEIDFNFNRRDGNTKQEDINIGVELNRNTSSTRTQIEYLDSSSETDQGKTDENTRLTGIFDIFVSNQLFLRPASIEYYRDPFQNIDSRWTYTAALGYQFLDQKDLTIDVFAGPGYQETKLDRIEEGEDSSLSTSLVSIGTTGKYDLTKNIELDMLYTMKFVEEESGDIIYHFEFGAEVDLVDGLEIEMRYIVDRLKKALKDGEDSELENNDSRLYFGVSYQF